MTEPQVRVEGLRELRRDLRSAQNIDRKREVVAGFRKAADVVADEAKLRANSFSFRLSDTIRSSASWQSGSPQGFVQGGRAAYPWYGWADFGSRSPRRGQSRSVGPWTGSGRGPRKGRFIYPAIEFKERESLQALETGIAEALRREDLPTTET